MTTYAELVEQRKLLDVQIEQTYRIERREAIAQIRAQMLEYGLSPRDLSGGSSGGSAKKEPGQAKYRDPATGATWTGKGKPPRWIAGQDRDQFLIA